MGILQYPTGVGFTPKEKFVFIALRIEEAWDKNFYVVFVCIKA